MTDNSTITAEVEPRPIIVPEEVVVIRMPRSSASLLKRLLYRVDSMDGSAFSAMAKDTESALNRVGVLANYDVNLDGMVRDLGTYDQPGDAQ